MSVLTLPDAKGYLNISNSTNDHEIEAMIDAAETVIAARCGPLEPTTTTVRIDGAGVLMLPVVPVISLTSVTPDTGSALTVGDLYVDTNTGLVSHNGGLALTGRYYTIVYQAGRAVCPPDLLMAVRELVRHMWQTQRGPTRRPGSPASETVSNTVPGAAYMLPFRVSELIAPHVQLGII